MKPLFRFPSWTLIRVVLSFWLRFRDFLSAYLSTKGTMKPHCSVSGCCYQTSSWNTLLPKLLRLSFHFFCKHLKTIWFHHGLCFEGRKYLWLVFTSQWRYISFQIKYFCRQNYVYLGLLLFVWVFCLVVHSICHYYYGNLNSKST